MNLYSSRNIQQLQLMNMIIHNINQEQIRNLMAYCSIAIVVYSWQILFIFIKVIVGKE